MANKIGSNFRKIQVLIYSSWLWNIYQRIFLVQGRIAKKMDSTGNGSGNDTTKFGRSGNIEDIVDSSCKQLIKEIVKEISESIAVLYAQLSSLGKDMELLQITMEILTTIRLKILKLKWRQPM